MPVTLVKGRIELSEPDASEDLRLDFDGIHFISNGSIYAFAETVYVDNVLRGLSVLSFEVQPESGPAHASITCP